MLRALLWIAIGLGITVGISAIAVVQIRDVRQEIAAKEKAALDKSFLPPAAPSVSFSPAFRSDTADRDKPVTAVPADCPSRERLFPEEAQALRYGNGIGIRRSANNPELIIKLKDDRTVSLFDTGCKYGRYVFVSALSSRNFAVVAHLAAPGQMSALVVSTKTGRITRLNSPPLFIGSRETMVITYGADDESFQPYLTIYETSEDRLLPVAWCLTAVRTSRETLKSRLLHETTFDLIRIDEFGMENGYTRFYRDRDKGWTVNLKATKRGMRNIQEPINTRCLTSPPDFARLP